MLRCIKETELPLYKSPTDPKYLKAKQNNTLPEWYILCDKPYTGLFGEERYIDFVLYGHGWHSNITAIPNDEYANIIYAALNGKELFPDESFSIVTDFNDGKFHYPEEYYPIFTKISSN